MTELRTKIEELKRYYQEGIEYYQEGIQSSDAGYIRACVAFIEDLQKILDETKDQDVPEIRWDKWFVADKAAYAVEYFANGTCVGTDHCGPIFTRPEPAKPKWLPVVGEVVCCWDRDHELVGIGLLGICSHGFQVHGYYWKHYAKVIDHNDVKLTGAQIKARSEEWI